MKDNSLERTIFLMKYDKRKTLTENIQEQQVSSSPEDAIAGQIYSAGFGWTDEEEMVNAISQIKNVDQFNKVNDLLTKSYDRMGFVGKMNDEFDPWLADDRKYLDQIKNHLTSIGVNFNYVPMKSNSIRVNYSTPQPAQSPTPQSGATQANASKPVTSPKPQYIWKESPFKTKEEGNKFRKWMNDNFSELSRQIKLDPQGSPNNSYIKKAFETKIQNSDKSYGQYYFERMGNESVSQIGMKGVNQIKQEPQNNIVQPTKKEVTSAPLPVSKKQARQQNRINKRNV